MFAGLGWTCALPVAPTFPTRTATPPYDRYEVAVSELGGESRVVLLSGSWPVGLQDADPAEFARAFFANAKRSMGLELAKETKSQVTLDGLACEVRDVVGALDAIPLDARFMLCHGRALMIVWSGPTSRLADVIASCHLVPIAPE